MQNKIRIFVLFTAGISLGWFFEDARILRSENTLLKQQLEQARHEGNVVDPSDLPEGNYTKTEEKTEEGVYYAFVQREKDGRSLPPIPIYRGVPIPSHFSIKDTRNEIWDRPEKPVKGIIEN